MVGGLTGYVILGITRDISGTTYLNKMERVLSITDREFDFFVRDVGYDSTPWNPIKQRSWVIEIVERRVYNVVHLNTRGNVNLTRETFQKNDTDHIVRSWPIALSSERTEKCIVSKSHLKL